MPMQYTAIKEKALKEGMSDKAAKTKEARIYNWMRSKHPSWPKLSNKKGAK